VTIRICSVHDVPPGEGRAARVAGVPIAVFRAEDGDWYAVQADCPHRGGPLADGIVGERSVICPLHERRFDLASGEPLGHECGVLRTYRVVVEGDEVLLVAS
jgi:nitrite reductase (NADH) small subunit